MKQFIALIFCFFDIVAFLLKGSKKPKQLNKTGNGVFADFLDSSPIYTIKNIHGNTFNELIFGYHYIKPNPEYVLKIREGNKFKYLK